MLQKMKGVGGVDKTVKSCDRTCILLSKGGTPRELCEWGVPPTPLRSLAIKFPMETM